MTTAETTIDQSALNSMLETLPVLPTVASRIMAMDKDSDDYYEQVLSLAQEDPVIAAKIIQLANSAAMAGIKRIETLPQAVARVGINQASSLIISISLSSSFKPTSPTHCNLWVHALQTAVFARRLAHLNRLNVEQAYLAGLLHEIGRFLLLSSDKGKFDSIDVQTVTTTPELLDAERLSFGFSSADIASAAMEHWGIPEPVATAITKHLASKDSSDKYSAVLTAADRVSVLAMSNPELENADESECADCIKTLFADINGNGIFLPHQFVAQAYGGLLQEAAELTSSLGISQNN